MPEAADSTEPRDRALYERHLAHLSELADMGMELARDIKTKALADNDTADVRAKNAQAFAKVARSVRQSLMLQDKIIQTMKGKLAPADAEPIIIKRIIVSSEHNCIERLSRERLDRPDQDDIYDIVDHAFPKSFPTGEGGPNAQRLGDGAFELPPGAPGKAPSVTPLINGAPPPPAGKDLEPRPNRPSG